MHFVDESNVDKELITYKNIDKFFKNIFLPSYKIVSFICFVIVMSSLFFGEVTNKKDNNIECKSFSQFIIERIYGES